MSSPNIRLKQEIDNSGVSLKELAELSGVNLRSLYYSLDDGHDFRLSLLEKLSHVIKIDTGFIMTGIATQPQSVQSIAHFKESDDSVQSIGHIENPKESVQSIAHFGDEFVFVPYYKVLVAAGDGRVAEDKQPRPFAFRAYFIKKTLGASLKDLFLLSVSGDSMMPKLNDGDMIMVDRSRRKVNTDAIYVVRIDDLYRVKRVQLIGKDTIRLISDNKVYPDVSVPLDENIEIVGEVVWHAGVLGSR